MTLDEGTQKKLAEALDPSAVSVLEHNGAPYLEGWYVISAANGIFGFDGWSHEVLGIEHMGNGLYSARVRVTALGVERVDVGTGSASRDTAEAHETAIKGAATDGLKRALRTFGAQFGNSLYEKLDRRAPAPQGQQRPQERRPPVGEREASAGFLNVGQVFKWAFDTHKLSRDQVLKILGAPAPDAIDLDTAQVDIEASLGVAPVGAR